MKTGIVLEGGALRTIFSSGVTDGLLKAGVDFDYLIGVSAGIAYGVSYISKQFGRNLEILKRYANDKRYMGARNLFKPGNRCYFGLKFTYQDIPDKLVPFDYKTFAAWPGRAEAVVTNVETGKAEYLEVPRTDDDHFKLLQATCAMPLLFPVYHIGGKKYLDGGAADAIPYRRAFAQGCDRVVVVLTRERSYRRRPEKLQKAIDLRYRQYPAFCETMRERWKVYNAAREELFRLEEEGKVFLFAPENTQGFSRVERDQQKIQALWRAGYDQADARLEELRAFLGA